MTRGKPRKWFGRTAPASPELSEAMSELERLAAEQCYLSPQAQILAELLPLLCRPSGPADGLGLEKPRLLAKLQAGRPILYGESLRFDLSDFQRRWRRVCRCIERRVSTAAPQSGKSAAAKSLGGLLARAGWSSRELVDSVLAGEIRELVDRAEAECLPGERLKSVLRFVLFPLLSPAREQCAELLERCSWTTGNCPVCGSWPLLAELRGLEQERFLRCGLCAAAWQFPRVECPFCRSRDHHQLGYLHVEEEGEKYRLATCDRCHGYLKAASTLASVSGPRLFVLDLATLHLDLVAQDRGFRSIVESES